MTKNGKEPTTTRIEKLKRIELPEDPFTSTALVIDTTIKDPKIGKTVALICYSSGGHIVILFKDGYDIRELLVAGEKYLGETLTARRFKVFKATVVKENERT